MVCLFRGGFVGKERRGFYSMYLHLPYSVMRGTRTLARIVMTGPSLDSSLLIHASVNGNNFNFTTGSMLLSSYQSPLFVHVTTTCITQALALAVRKMYIDGFPC